MPEPQTKYIVIRGGLADVPGAFDNWQEQAKPNGEDHEESVLDRTLDAGPGIRE